MIKIRKYTPNSGRYLLWEMYQDTENYGEFFRRINPDITEENIVLLEEVRNGSLYCVFSDSELIGFGVISEIDPFGLTCQTGLIIHKNFWKDKKTAPKATIELLRHIFKKTLIQKASMRFLKSRRDIESHMLTGGFTKESHLRNSIYYNGNFCDELEYSILKDEFFARYN